MSRLLMTFTLVSFALAAPVVAGPVRSGAIEAELISETDSITAGESTHVAIRLKTAPHWHVYWKNPGDSGTPVKAKWELPETVKAGPLVFPAPKEYEAAGFVTFGHEGEFYLLTKLLLAPSAKVGASLPIKVTVSWLACDPSRCLPGRAELALNLKVTAGDPKPNQWTKKVNEAKQALPKKTKGIATIAGSKVSITISIPAKSAAPSEARFFPLNPGKFKLSDPKPKVTQDSKEKLTITLEKEDDSDLPETISGVLTLPDGDPIQVEAER